MTIQTTILPEAGYTQVRMTGHVDQDAVVLDVAEYCADPDYLPGTPELVDLSEVTDLALSFRMMCGLVHKMNQLYGNAARSTRIALFAPDDLAFGMSRMFEQVADGRGGLTAAAFRDNSEALCWIQCSHDVNEGLISGARQASSGIL